MKKLLEACQRLITAMDENMMSCEEYGIDDTGAFVKELHINEELEELRGLVSGLKG